MRFRELLEELREQILRDVSDALSVDQADLLWPDKALVRYINDAYVRFSSRTRLLVDASTPEVCHIELVPGQQSYPLHPKVIGIKSAYYEGRALKLAAMHEHRGLPDEVAHLGSSGVANYRGVSAYFPEYEASTFYVTGAPRDADDGKVVHLRTVRLPLIMASEDTMNESPEIPEQYHLDLIEGAAWRALRNHDPDAEFMAKASAHHTRFREAIEEAKEDARMATFSGAQFVPSWRW